MLYVSTYDKSRDCYGVTDTDDGTTEWAKSGELFNIVSKMRISIQGVDPSQMRIRVVAQPQAKKKEPVVQTRLQFLDEQVGFDYVLEQHECGDYTEFVISNGGDVSRYRVYGQAGSYSVYAK